MTQYVEIDSLVANEFAVELDGEAVSGVFRVSHLRTYATDENGERIKPPFEIAKMVQRDANNPFNTWLRETLEGDEAPTRTLTILAIDDAVTTRKWTAHHARIAEVRYSTFDTGSSVMVEEIYTIAYDGITDEFTT